MADAAPVMLWVTEADGRCTFLNRAWLDFTGQTLEEGLGLGWLDAVHPDDAAAAERVFLEATARGGPFRVDYRLRRADGQYRRAVDAAAPRLGPGGEFLGFVGSVVDLEERARLLDAERAARAQAEQARADAEEANRAKGQFLANMSHELRTPLNAIAGYVQLLDLELYGAIAEPQREALQRVRRAQEHLLGLITDVLNYAKLESGRVEYDLGPVDLRDVVADVAPLVGPQLAARGVAFELRLPDGPQVARADRERVGQVLLNLLSNAVKFTDAGGRVRVEVAGDPGAGRALLTVADTGRGIAADKLDAVFEPFVQLRPAYGAPSEGTGLGLSISRDLARGMGGELLVESEVGVGSRFTLALPAA
jgi:PAS domain S-box-containing protein